MRFHGASLAAAALALLACRPEKDSYVVIHSDVNCDVPRVFQLRVTISNGATTDQKTVPETPGAELGFPSSITLVLPSSRNGSIDLVVEAVDSKRQLIGQGATNGILVSGGRIDLQVQLAAVGTTGPVVVAEPSRGVDGGVAVDSGNGAKLDVAPGSGVPFTQVAVGAHSTCALRSDTGLWCWGTNTYGELRLFGAADRLTPTETSGISWTTLASGQTHACGIRADGTLSCWGNNGSGQLGAATTAAIPQAEVPGGPWQGVATGSYHSCGIKADTTLWCWGNNANGQLGSGDTVEKTDPSQVTGTGWTQVSTSYYHACAVKQDGTLWCWGLNADMQLAIAAPDFRMSPGQVTGSDWTAVTTGLYHTCAIKQDDSLWCWGRNTAGQLGNADVPVQSDSRTSTPMQVAGTWSNVSAGQAHTCGVMSDQSLWCWGDNAKGQLGNRSLISVSTPAAVAVPGEAWALVDAGVSHTCALATDGSLWCWGDNTHGQLGLGSTGWQQVPVRVVQ